jgi:CRP/FNR family transcriptional activator FtrB
VSAVRKEQSDLVRALALFMDIDDAQFRDLMRAALLQRFPQGVTLIAEGEMPDFLHIIVDGAIELFATYEGHQTTLDILEPVSTFILAAVVRDEPYLKSARTLTSAQILMIPAGAVRKVFDADAAFARAVVNELAVRYRSVVRALKNEKLRTSIERLANWILQEDLHQGRTHDVVLKSDKRTLASHLGMTPENLSRNLATLARHGVRTAGNRLVIDDPAALQRFARPSPLIDDLPSG